MSSPSPLSPVLLVDDNADDLFLLRQRLLRAPVANPIVAFPDAEEAMAYLQDVAIAGPATAPCVMFLDVRMPRRGGFEVLKWVREQPALALMTVVMVSTSTLPEDAARAQKLGARYLVKHPTPDVLGKIVHDAMRARER